MVSGSMGEKLCSPRRNPVEGTPYHTNVAPRFSITVILFPERQRTQEHVRIYIMMLVQLECL